MAEFLSGVTTTRTHSVSIVFTDGGGSFTTFGSIGFANEGIIWTTAWSDRFAGPGEFQPVDLAGNPIPLGRRVVLTISMGTLGNQTWTIDNPLLLTGTASISVPTREIVEMGYIAPITSGPIVVDPGMQWGVRSREFQTGSVSLTATILGSTLSRTRASTSARVLPTWTTRSEVRVAGTGDGAQLVSGAGPATGDVDTSTKSAGATVAVGGGSYTYATIATATSTSALADAVASGVAHPEVFAVAYTTQTAPRVADLHGALYAMTALYDQPIQYRTTDTAPWETTPTNGGFTKAINQRAFDTVASVFEHTGTLGAGGDRHQASELRNLFPRYRFTDRYGNTQNGALPLHGPQWAAIQLDKTLAATVDDGTSLTPSGLWAGVWSGTGGASVSVASGAIKATGSSGKGIKRTITGGGSLGGYSRLKVRLKCSAASHSVTVRLGDPVTEGGTIYSPQSWQVTTGAANTATDLYIDLGAQTDSPMWPASVWDVGYRIASPAWYRYLWWGAGLTTPLYIEGLGAGDYEVEDVEALMAPGSEPSLSLFPGGRKLAAICDTIPVLEKGIGAYILGTGGAGSVGGGGTLTGIVTSINADYAGLGWSATDLAPAPSSPGAQPWPLSYASRGNWGGAFLGGEGLLWSGGSWSVPISPEGQGYYTYDAELPAQWLVYEAAWDWPETELGGFRISEALGAGWNIGASLWGRVLETASTQTPGDATAPAGRDPAPSVAVELLDTLGNSLATTTTGADGWYAFPALASLQGAARLKVSGMAGWFEKPLHDVRSRLVVMRQPPPDGTLLAMAVSATGRVVRGYRDTDDTLLLEFWVRAGWDTKDTTLTVTGSGALAYDAQSAQGRLWLAIEETGAIKTRYTDDEGDTWSVATTIFASGEKPALCVSPTGVRHYFCVSSGTIKTKVLDSQGNVLIAESTVVASGVGASAIDAVHDGALILLTYRNTSNQVVTVISSDGGATFI